MPIIYAGRFSGIFGCLVVVLILWTGKGEECGYAIDFLEGLPSI